jgi:Bifunctional DNA primase/polymerase, N-terminal/AAA domain/Primase C terminal 1 (PriCT-1)
VEAVSEMLDAVLKYARRVPVLAVQPRGKNPLAELCPHGFKDATQDESKLREWWGAHPDANIGIPTGPASGIDLLDVDVHGDKDGERTLAELIGKHGALPATREVRTGGGGRHLWFRSAPGLRCGTDALGLGLDVKAAGGYMLAPPSQHATGNVYAFTNQLPWAPWPEWVLALLIQPKPAEAETPRESAAGKVRHPHRHQSLMSLAGDMRHRGLGEAAIRAALLVHNQEICEPPLPDDEVGEIARSAGKYQPGNNAKPPSQAVMRRASDIKPEHVQWLWPGRIPLGKLTLFAGDPDQGKTCVAVDAAARVSGGGEWPDGARVDSGSVIIMSAEDDPADTLVPRLIAAGAHLERVHFLEASRLVTADGKNITRNVTLADLATIEDGLKLVNDVRLVIVDPVSAYLSGETDSHKNAEVRCLLAPLAELAAKRRISVVLITHLAKSGGSALYRAIGSIAFIAAARAGWIFGRDKEDPERRLMLPLKNNLAADLGGLAYSLEGCKITVEGGEAPVVKVHWHEGTVDLKADDLFAAEPEDRSEVTEAIDLLKVALAGGAAVESTSLLSAAEDAGISRRTLFRAKKKLGVVANRAGGFGPDGYWEWSLPESDTKSAGAAKSAPKSATPADVALLVQDHEIKPVSSTACSKSANPEGVAPLAGTLSQSGGEPDDEEIDL